MKQAKRIWKIGLSLLIAMAFIIPAGSIMAYEERELIKITPGMESPEAEDFEKQHVERPDMANKLDGITDQDGFAYIVDLAVENPAGDIFAVNSGDIIPVEDFYHFYAIIGNMIDPATIEPELDLYRITEGEEVLMYETSFEDNFDIYNNWVQIDGDCGLVGGHFDSWSWSDARASDGDHSMKNTMYDIYKGNQLDYLECTIPFDMTGQYGVLVEFDIWVEGHGDYFGYTDSWGLPCYTVIDYLSFEIWDAGVWYNPYYTQGLDFTDTSGYDFWESYHFFDTSICLYDINPSMDYTWIAEDIGGGWWHVWAEIPIGWWIDPTETYFRFRWISDPQFQYEGAYVDNFRVISIENVETKVFQTHSQDWLLWEPWTYGFKFPLPWTDVEPGYYMAILKLKNDMGGYDDIDYIYFEVGDFIDCELWDMYVEDSFTGLIVPDGGRVYSGSDAHIVYTYHQGGNVPVSDVLITATVQEIQWEEVYFNDFEGLIWSDHGAFDGPDLWHKTSLDSWSGSNALGCFDKDTGHYHNDMYINYIIGPMVDMDGVEQAFVDYYFKCLSEGSMDALLFMLYDPATNYVLGCSSPYWFYGYHPDWIGPMNPECYYEPFDLKYYFDYWQIVRGMYHDCNGQPTYDVGFGFRVQSTDGDTYTNAQAESEGIYWSGWYFDDVSIRTLNVGDTVFTDSMTIPGPLEPCDTYTAQFEWEDVPTSMYRICVEATCADDVDLSDNIICQDIIVMDDLEFAWDNKMESIDYTSECDGEWGICSSDYDNYISTNPDTNYPAAWANQVLELCPDGESCLDISHFPSALGGFYYIEMFDSWGDGWNGGSVDILLNGVPTYNFVGPATSYAFEQFFVANGDMISTLWNPGSWDGEVTYIIYDDLMNPVAFDGPFPAGVPPGLIPPVMLASPTLFTFVTMEFDYYSDLYDGVVYLQYNELCSDLEIDWSTAAAYTGFSYNDPMADPDGFVHETVTLMIPGIQAKIRFLFLGGGVGLFTGFQLDDIFIADLFDVTQITDPAPVYADFYDPCDDMDNWCTTCMTLGDYWVLSGNQFCIDIPALPIHNAVIWETEIADAYEAYLYGIQTFNVGPGTTLFVELSADGGNTWYIIQKLEGGAMGGGAIECTPFDLSPWAGQEILIRFRVLSDGSWTGQWCVEDVHIIGKKDNTAPMTTIQMSGTQPESGWFSTPVQVTITAVDDTGMGDIHYILDGQEFVVPGDIAKFTISENGPHTLEFWGVDKVGNEEVHHTVPQFRIDTGSPPSVAITAPEPGLYLFGNKLLSSSKVFIIGAFTIEATATDAESGVYRVQFFLDGDIIAEDTEAPFSAYCAQKHMGAGTIKVVAEDFAMNTAEDTLDVTYYKFL
jgi:hypothetical protein